MTGESPSGSETGRGHASPATSSARESGSADPSPGACESAPHEPELRQFLEQLADRLARIESHLGLPPLHSPEPRARSAPETPRERARPTIEPSPPASPREVETTAPAHRARAEAQPAQPASSQEPPAKAVAIPPIASAHSTPAPRAAETTPAPRAAGTIPFTPRGPRAVPSTNRNVRAPDRADRGDSAARRISLEALIGGKWLAWLGSLAIVIGAGFLASYIDVASIWGRIPDEMKCLLLAAFGAALLIAGEIVHRRLGKLASVGLCAAGLGTLYVTAYATAGWYGVLPEVGSFALLALVALTGLALTWRLRSRAIGVLSILAAYLAPILVPTASTFALAMPLYLSAIFALALALSLFAPAPFRVARYLALAGQILVGFLWVASAEATWQEFLVFGGMWWAMATAEALVVATRGQSAAGNVIMSFLMTVWFALVASSLGLASGEPAAWLGAFTISIAILSIAAALQFGTGIEALRERARVPLDLLTVSLWTQAAILIPLAVAFQFDGYARTVSWLLIGFAATETGRLLRSRAVDVFGLVVGALAIARVALFDWWASPALRETIAALGPVTVTAWSLLALGAIAILFTAAFRLRLGERGWNAMPVVLSAFGVAGWIAVTATHVELSYLSAAWLAGGALLVAIVAYTGAGRAQQLAPLGTFLTMLAAAKWIAFDTIAASVEGSLALTRDLAPFANARFVIGMLLAAMGAWFATSSAIRARLPMSASRWWPVASAIIILWAASFEVATILERAAPFAGGWSTEHMMALWLILLWGAGGLAMRIFSDAFKHVEAAVSGNVLVLAAGAAWLLVGTLLFRTTDGLPSDAAVLFNVQFLIGALLGAALLIIGFLPPRAARAGESRQGEPVLMPAEMSRLVAFALAGAIALWLGSLEIDRFFGADAMAKQTGFSIWWSLFGIGLIVLGFARNVATVRYVGLGMLAITLIKVGLIDTSQLEGIYRPLSLMVVGLLLVATSVGYIKLTPRILKIRALNMDTRV